MAQNDVLLLVDSLALGIASLAQATTYYTDVVRILGQELVLTNAQAQDLTANVQAFVTPNEAIQLLCVFVGDQELRPTNELVLEAINRDWRLTSGSPRAYTLEDLPENFFVLYPYSVTGAGPVATTFADQFGPSFVDGQISLIYTEERLDVPEWLEMWLAFSIIEREFLRESDHRDAATATAANQLAAVIKKMVS